MLDYILLGLIVLAIGVISGALLAWGAHNNNTDDDDDFMKGM